MGRRGKKIVQKSSIIVQLREALSNEELDKVATLPMLTPPPGKVRITALWPLHPEYRTVGAILTSCTSV